MAVRVNLAPKGDGQVRARANRLAGFVGTEGPAREVSAAIKTAVRNAAGRDRSQAKVTLFLDAGFVAVAADPQFFTELGQFVATRGMVTIVHLADRPNDSVEVMGTDAPYAP